MTRSPHSDYTGYLVIWVMLIMLLAASTYISYLPISRIGVILLILGVAFVKTALVALFYMHLKFERLVPVWVVVLFPLLLVGVAVLLVTLIPALV